MIKKKEKKKKKKKKKRRRRRRRSQKRKRKETCQRKKEAVTNGIAEKKRKTRKKKKKNRRIREHDPFSPFLSNFLFELLFFFGPFGLFLTLVSYCYIPIKDGVSPRTYSYIGISIPLFDKEIQQVSPKLGVYWLFHTFEEI